MRAFVENHKGRTGHCDQQIGRGLLRGVMFVLAVSVAPGTILSGCGGGSGEGSGGSGSQAPFTVAAESSASGAQGSGLLLPVDLTRHPGFTDTVTVTLDNPPAGVEADTIVFSGVATSAWLHIRVTEQAALGNHTLSVIGKSPSASHKASATLTVSAAQPLAQEKILEALQAGKLDYGTSLLYRAYALFGDRRLPTEYQGPSLEEDNGLFIEIRKVMGTLPGAMQAQLQPFIARPADPTSVWNATASTATGMAALHHATAIGNVLAAPAPEECPERESGGWVSKRSATHPVRVWAQCRGLSSYDAESQRLIDQTLGVLDKVYDPMTKLMKEPILDIEGGDDAIDFYILDPGTYAFRRNEWHGVLGDRNGQANTDYPIEGKGASGFVLLLRSFAYTQSFHTTVIHEFFHVLQFKHAWEFAFRPISSGVNINEQHWFHEASAVWAAAHFDRTLAPWEDGRAAYLAAHARFTHRFQVSSLGLNATVPREHSYSAYIWSYFVEHKNEGNPNFMSQIWTGLENVTTFEQADDVIDSVYPFDKNFKTFALQNLNKAYLPGDPLPRSERYVSLDPDHFPDATEPPYLPENGPGDLKSDLESAYLLQLNNLSARYVRLLAQESKIQQVQIDFSQLQPAEFTDVQALVRTTNGWVSKPLDLGNGTTTFCFDKGPTTTDVRGSFIEILLVVANHGKRESNKVAGNLIVRPKSAPCPPFPDYEGTTSFIATGETIGKIAVAEGTVRAKWEFETYNPETKVASYFFYEGTLSIAPASYLERDCHFSFSPTTLPVTGPRNSGILRVNYSTSPPTFRISAGLISSGIQVRQDLTLTKTCPRSGTFSSSGQSVFWALPFFDPPPLNANADGTVLKGVTQGQQMPIAPVLTITHSYQAISPP